MKRIATLLGALMLALSFGVAQAAAEEDPGGAEQTAGQSAGSGQDADGNGSAYQSGPTNNAQSIRVLSPGSNGSVSQSNTTTAAAIAANANKTDQDIDQSQAGSGHGSDYSQVAGQEAENDQDADADAKAVQIAPSNTAQSIRVLSPGDNGDLNQSNAATAGAAALNGNKTDQDIDQSQAGSGHGSDYSQVAGQEAKNDQDADADAKAVQVKPSNTASSIRVLSPGDDGEVEQTNSTTALAAALNANKTDQSIDQDQGGEKKAPYESEKSDGKMSDGGSSYSQVAGQEAKSDQDADADAKAVQVKPSNTASSIRVLSPGDDGDVEQTNAATAVGIAANVNKTDQSIDQDQPGGMSGGKSDGKKSDGGSSYSQVAGQEAKNDQDADADAKAVQVKPSNTASSIRVLSKGDDGDVEQTNSTTALAAALNANKTDQSIDQDQGGAQKAPYREEEKSDGKKSDDGSSYSQIAGQSAKNDQDADADAKAVQVKPSNTASSIRVLSHGDDGDVEQTNAATAVGIAANVNKTDQSIDQDQSGHGQGSDYSQVAGQEAKNDQDADADAKAVQVKPSNTASSIRVLSKGDGGDVEQTNSTTALAAALNANKTDQSIDQDQGGAQKAPYREEREVARQEVGRRLELHADRGPIGQERSGRRR